MIFIIINNKKKLSFFNKMHTNHYKVYNLCSERTYDKTRFPDVSYYPFEDHQAPEFSLIYRFCKDLFQYIHADREGKNTAGVHCKAGKGRTGVMICCYLMYSGEFEKAIDALRYYGLMRTNNKKVRELLGDIHSKGSRIIGERF